MTTHTHSTLTRLAIGRLHSERTAARRADQRITAALAQSNSDQAADVETARRIAAGKVTALLNGRTEN